MLKNKDIVCISTIDWDFLWQRHQILMTHFAAEGNRVIYLENINPSVRLDLSFIRRSLIRMKRIFFGKGKGGVRLPPGVTVITPLLVPFGNRLARWANDRVFLPLIIKRIKAQTNGKPIIWTYRSTASAVRLIKSLAPGFLVYDCVYDVSAHPDSPKDGAAVEAELIRSADVVFTDNNHLFDRCKALNASTYIIHPGLDEEHFPLGEAQVAARASDSRSKLCFFGGIDQIRLDLELIEYLARRNADWDIVLLGPVIKTDIARLKGIPNVIFKQPVEYARLAHALKEMDILILPYKIIPFSKSIFPAKIFECLATGKPVVSTALEELIALQKGLIRIAYSHDEFFRLVNEALNSDDAGAREQRIAFARDSSWSGRYEKIKQIIEKKLQDKNGQTLY